MNDNKKASSNQDDDGNMTLSVREVTALPEDQRREYELMKKRKCKEALAKAGSLFQKRYRQSRTNNSRTLCTFLEQTTLLKPLAMSDKEFKSFKPDSHTFASYIDMS